MVACIALFVVPRRQIFLPMILLTVMVPAAQRVVIAGLDFHFLRIADSRNFVHQRSELA